MKILVFGAGAIGSYLGGSLGCSGHQVVFIEKPELADTIQSAGIVIRGVSGDCTYRGLKVTSAIGDALQYGPFDAAFFALKSYDTAVVARQMAEYADALPPVVCFQNGVENEALLASAIGAEKVIAGTVTSAISRSSQGGIIIERQRGVGVARGGDGLSQALVQAFLQTGIPARQYVDAASMKWSKMLTNLQANASAAILNMTPGEIFANPALFRMERAQLLEALQVMRKLRIDIIDLPGTPVRAFAFLVQFPILWLSRVLLARAIGKGRGAKMPSFHIDLYSGRRQSEVDFLNGAVIRYGERAGVPTPVNRVLRDTLLQLTTGVLAKDSFDHQPLKLLSILKEYV